MKLEMGESLILSWLRHIKSCQIVQMNWKPSCEWQNHELELVENFFISAKQKFGGSIFKNNTLQQLMKQAEIDVLGINFKNEHDTEFYAVDIAYHEDGLNYGSREETLERVIKKMLRTSFLIMNIFKNKHANIIFASPKISSKLNEQLLNAFHLLEEMSQEVGHSFKFILISNSDFYNQIISPTLKVSKNISDTSELFLRSFQLIDIYQKEENVLNVTSNSRVISEEEGPNIPKANQKKNFTLTFYPNESEFKKLLQEKKHAYIKLIYEDGNSEVKEWDAKNFTSTSNLRGNIHSKTYFRSGYNQNGHVVIEGIFSIDEFKEMGT